MIHTQGVLKKVGHRTFHVVCSADLNKYLRTLFNLLNSKAKKLLPPMNGSHITANYGVDEELKSKSGIIVEFSIVLELYTNGNAYWCPIISPQLEQIRIDSGLPTQNSIGLHYCVGYLREGKNYEKTAD